VHESRGRRETELDDKIQDENSWSFFAPMLMRFMNKRWRSTRHLKIYGMRLYDFAYLGIFQASDRGLESAFCYITPDPDIGSSTCEVGHHKTVSPHPHLSVAKT